MQIAIDQIRVVDNPRTEFDIPPALVDSIKRLGVVQPLVVVKSDGAYKLLDGERRLRACKKAGIKEVPVIVKEYDEQEQKEIPIITDLMKDLLPVGDKAVAIARLVNKEKKYTAESIAKRLGMPLKQVRGLLKLATLHPKVLALINKGVIEAGYDALQLTKIGREDIQIKVANRMAQGEGFIDGLQQFAYELPFDDVFTYEQAKKDSKLGVVIEDEMGGDPVVFTFDKKYYEQQKATYEQREKKTYDEQLKKHSTQREQAEKEQVKQKADRKAQYKKAKSSYQKQIALYKEAVLSFLRGKPTEAAIDKLVQKFCWQLCGDDCKLLLRAFGVKFKVKDMTADDYKKMVYKTLQLSTEQQLAKLIMLVDLLKNTSKVSMWEISPLKKLIVTLSKG